MWPLLMGAVRRNIPMVTLPFAALIGTFEPMFLMMHNFTFCDIFTGFVGYHLEGWLSDKYTPYNCKNCRNG